MEKIKLITMPIYFLCLTFSYNMLVHHNHFNNEIHIKIGGDHGGGSFKMNYQVANVLNPNSVDNTIVFSIFEAKDYRVNIKTCSQRFAEQINYLQQATWR